MARPDVHTLLSVRGEAQRAADADQATIHTTVSRTRDTKQAASADTAVVLASVIAELADLDGEVLTAQSSRAPLTWSTQSMRTGEEHGPDKSTGMHGPTGRHQSSVSLLIAVRDFTLLHRMEMLLTRHDALNIDWIDWSVDEDNAAWALVRADAIRAALLKAQDYASALGGSVVGVEHVADAGLLGGDAHGPGIRGSSFAAAASIGAGPDPSSLDPVPQVLTATIEARLTAIVGPLPTR
jgi:hypothetical protein